MSLRECYEEIKNLGMIPDERLDSFRVIKAVADYRNTWKPDEVRLVLLAESHKHTTDFDFDHTWRYPEHKPQHGGSYVRFVYCLANGERDLVPLPTNKGTWQYWKLLFSCLNPVSDKKTLVPVLQKYSQSFERRMREKIVLLTSLRDAGLWLLDASVIGIAAENSRTRSEIIQRCWKTYVGPNLKELYPRPRHLIVVGSGVDEVLRKEINEIDPHHTVIRQPNAHIRGGYPDYMKCFEACSRYLTSG